MSLAGPSALGTLLVQRLDAVLGTTLAQQANLLSGARPDAVSQPPGSQRPGRSDTVPGRDPRQAADRVDAQRQRQPQPAIKDAQLQTALALAGNRRTDTGTTSSAPTTLGAAARTILALLARFPQAAPPVTGKALWQPPAGKPPLAAGSNAAPYGAASAASPDRNGGAPLSRGLVEPRTTTASTGPARDAAVQAAAQAAPTAPGLARALAKVLDNSGLFYESHLAAVAFGKRNPGRLANEPQARWASPGSGGPGANGATAASQATSGPATPQAAAGAPAPAAQPAADGSASGSPGASGASGSPPASGSAGPAAGPALQQAPIPGLHPDATLIVRQQLEVLAHQVFAWQGEAWPGTPMRWEIGRDDPAQAHEGPTTWSTRLSVNLPRLGTVEARIGLAGNELVMHLSAADSAAELQEHAEVLRRSCRAAGLTLSGLSVTGQAPSPAPEAP